MVGTKICIKNGIVVNIIVAEDGFSSDEYDLVLRKEDYANQKIALGYSFANDIFTAPPPTLDALTATAIKIQRAIDLSQKLMTKYAADNVLNGITQLGKTKLIADTMENVIRYCQTGSLYQALAEMDNIVITSDMAPFLTEDKRTQIKADILNIIKSL